MIAITLLKELVEKPMSGEWGEGEGSVNVIRTTNFSNNGRIDFSKIVRRDISEKKVLEKKLLAGDIIIEKSGGSPTQPVGRVVYFDSEGEYLCNNFTSILRPKKKYVFPKYLHYILFCNHKYGYVSKYQNKTTGIINLKLVNYLANITIPLPPLAKQQQIAAILDAADSLRQKDQQLVEYYTQLSQSLFLDMFGDPVANPMRWDVKLLNDLSTKIHSGNTPKGGKKVYVNKGIRFFRSQNVWRNRIALDEIAYIDKKTHESMKKSSLKHKDILMTKTGRFNTENSSLGRAAMFLGEDDTANVNGHVYLIRLKKEVINEFVLFILTTPQYRDYIRRVCVGGIDKRQINKDHLESFPIIYPPIKLQEEFAERLALIEQQKQQVQANLEKSNELFNSLLQKAFAGELTAKKAA